MVHAGGCHCGGIRLEFASDVDPAHTVVRACQCSFCRMHGSCAVADPAGRLVVRVADGSALGRYVFGLGTADFLVCPRCGVYVAAIAQGPDGATGIVTLNALDDRALFTAAPVATNHDRESRAERIGRRARTWTPARIEEGTRA
jgi:hypothetical protein